MARNLPAPTAPTLVQPCFGREHGMIKFVSWAAIVRWHNHATNAQACGRAARQWRKLMTPHELVGMQGVRA